MSKDYETGAERVQAPPAPQGPTLEQQATDREAALQAELQSQRIEAAKAQAKAEAMERFVQDSFQRGRQEVPQEAQVAVNDLGLTEEQILADPTGAIAKIAAQIRQRDEAMREYQQRVGNVVGNLAKSTFKAEMESLKSERFSEWLTPYVEDYFRKNPEEAFKEGAVRNVYNQLIGQNYGELERLEREKVGVPTQTRERVVEPSVRQSYSNVAPPTSQTNILPEDEMFMLESHNRKSPEQYRMTPEEWRDIRQGRKYPKAISTDIQVRGAKPNVSYERG